MPRTLPRQNRAPRGPYEQQRPLRHILRTREERRRFRERERRFQARCSQRPQYTPAKPVLHGLQWVTEYASGRGGLLLFGEEHGPRAVFLELPYSDALEEYLERFTEALTEEELADYAEDSEELHWINGKAYVEPEHLWAREFASKAELKAYLRERRS